MQSNEGDLRRAATPAGYRSLSYGRAAKHLGRIRVLPQSGAFVLVRAVPGNAVWDAVGSYPLFSCTDWAALERDLPELGQEAISLTLVTDPFGSYDEARLRRCFPDLAMVFKQHYVTDLSRRPETFVSAHHRRNTRMAEREVEVEVAADPSNLASDWIRLYARLASRHEIDGPADFPVAALEAQLSVPGVLALRAQRSSECLGMLLFYVDGEVAYYHLGAYDDEGYRLRASFALFGRALQVLAERGVRWLDLGSAAGLSHDDQGGLSRFKRGWSTGTRPAWLCGRIFDPVAYEALTAERGDRGRTFFPSYRQPTGLRA